MQAAPMRIEKKKMLLIDDDPKLLIGLRAVMTLQGYEVFSTSDGNEGLRMAKENKPDIIVCDVMMPKPNGFLIKTLLAGSEQTATIPFIFLTARKFPADKIAALNQGADDYITKPFNVDELISRIEAILRRNEIGRQRGLREMESKMETLRRSISTNLGHELRTPLTVILANMEMAMREKFRGRSEDMDWYLESSLSSAQKLSSLVEDMILLNDIDQQNINTRRAPINPEHDFMNPIREVCHRYDQKELDVRISVQDGVLIFAPQAEFTRAVLHLVDNACKFSPVGAEINIVLRKNGNGGCLLSIENQGSFIPKELREKVFERYYQVQQGDDRSNDGLGIGLSIVRAVAEACGGQATVADSKVGCKVYLILPPAANDAEN